MSVASGVAGWGGERVGAGWAPATGSLTTSVTGEFAACGRWG